MLFDNRREYLHAAAILFAGLHLAGSAQADPADSLLAEMREICAPGALTGPAEPYQPVPLALDGTEIALFDQTDWGCVGMPGLFRHTGGGDVILRAVLSASALETVQDSDAGSPPEGTRYRHFVARGWQLTEMNGLPVLLLARHGGYCGNAGYMPCIEAVTWTDGVFLSVGVEDTD